MRALVTNPILALQIALGVLTAVFVVGWSAAVRAIRRGPALEPSPATDTRFPDAPGIVIWRGDGLLRHPRGGLVRAHDLALPPLRLVPDRTSPAR